jgi:curved DNA-binding protein CbpA
VLGALTDADALGLPPHPTADAAKRAFRLLAKAIHPDKCAVPRATDAFQRIQRAYQRLCGGGV